MNQIEIEFVLSFVYKTIKTKPKKTDICTLRVLWASWVYLAKRTSN